MYIRSFVEGKQMTLTLSGEIDHHAAKQAMRTISEKFESYLPGACTLDFRDVTFMDSSGIAIVIFSVRRMRELGGKVSLTNVQPQPMKVFQAAGIEQIAEIKGRRTR